MDIPIDAKVQCIDGQCGKRDVAIPVSAIDVVDADDVYLNIDKEAVSALPVVPMKRH